MFVIVYLYNTCFVCRYCMKISYTGHCYRNISRTMDTALINYIHGMNYYEKADLCARCPVFSFSYMYISFRSFSSHVHYISTLYFVFIYFRHMHITRLLCVSLSLIFVTCTLYIYFVFYFRLFSSHAHYIFILHFVFIYFRHVHITLLLYIYCSFIFVTCTFHITICFIKL